MRAPWTLPVCSWTHDFEANTEMRHSAFSRAELVVLPFEVREEIEGEHITETDLIRCHEVGEEGAKFESSFLSLDRCC